jgi:hypothetical protein
MLKTLESRRAGRVTPCAPLIAGHARRARSDTPCPVAPYFNSIKKIPIASAMRYQPKALKVCVCT